jgi:hypothetical protein
MDLRLLARALAQHLGVFLLLFALTWGAVRFVELPPKALYAVAPAYFIYLGIWLLTRNRTPGKPEVKERQS